MRGASREDAMVVAIFRDGKVFFGNDQTTAGQLSSQIQKRLNASPERKVYLKADFRARYGNVAEVVDAVRSAGIGNIAFLVEQRRTQFP